jgi:hypothetical protein
VGSAWPTATGAAPQWLALAAALAAAHDDADPDEIALETTRPRVLCYAQHPPTTQYTPMTNADDTTSLQEQLAAHRRTLAVYLRQLASLGADHAPPGVHNGIAEAGCGSANQQIKEEFYR